LARRRQQLFSSSFLAEGEKKEENRSAFPAFSVVHCSAKQSWFFQISTDFSISFFVGCDRLFSLQSSPWEHFQSAWKGKLRRE
jgi:hypothetical protein